MVEKKRVSESRTLQHYILMPMHMNGSNSLFGGQLLNWIDVLAGVVAMRHGDNPVVTAAIDNLNFRTGAYIADVLIMDGRVTWTGNSSMEIRIDTYRKAKDQEKELVNTAFLVMVAIDRDTKRPVKIPGLILETEEERLEWEAGEKRAQLRKARRNENY